MDCWIHEINLWIKDIMKLTWSENLIQFAKDIINYFQKYQVPLAILHWLQMKKYSIHIALLLPEQTRWGSAYYCIKNLMKTKVALCNTLHEEGIEIDLLIKQKIFNDFFWQELQILCNFLESFVKFINQLQSNQPRLSIAYSNLEKLNNWLFKILKYLMMFNKKCMNLKNHDRIIFFTILLLWLLTNLIYIIVVKHLMLHNRIDF